MIALVSKIGILTILHKLVDVHGVVWHCIDVGQGVWHWQFLGKLGLDLVAHFVKVDHLGLTRHWRVVTREAR